MGRTLKAVRKFLWPEQGPRLASLGLASPLAIKGASDGEVQREVLRCEGSHDRDWQRPSVASITSNSSASLRKRRAGNT
jgi:hypothetical protein